MTTPATRSTTLATRISTASVCKTPLTKPTRSLRITSRSSLRHQQLPRLQQHQRPLHQRRPRHRQRRPCRPPRPRPRGHRIMVKNPITPPCIIYITGIPVNGHPAVWRADMVSVSARSEVIKWFHIAIFHYSLSLRAKLISIQHCLRQWLIAEQDNYCMVIRYVGVCDIANLRGLRWR